MPRSQDPPDVDELAKLIMSWMGLSMKLQRNAVGVRLLADVGMTLQQIAALHILMFEGPLSVTTLTERLGLSLSATSHLVQKLVEQGYVSRVEDENDRRQKVIKLTQPGRKMVEKMMQSRLDELRVSVRHLSDTLRAELAPVLRHVVDELSHAAADAWGERGGVDWKSRGSDLRGQDLEGADLAGAVIPDARFDGANLEGARLNGGRFERARFDGTNLEGAELAGATLSDARFRGSNLEGAMFQDANLSCARFEACDLEGAELDGANLKGARFESCDLEGATFSGADLDGARFEHCDLEGAEFDGARNLPASILAHLNQEDS